MTATFLGVRHHSPACARLVAATIEELRPAYVLVEGPADMNDRLDELLLGHDLPIAAFSHYRDEQRAATSWTPLCDYSPEWVALRAGRAAGAQVRFIDLPAWHPAFAERTNRYADAEARYAQATERLCRHFSVDSVDTLWDTLFEVETDEGLRERLDTYFQLVRGDAEADAGDQAREEYMASWVRAALAEAGERPVLVVTGGFHQPALRALAGQPAQGLPDVPEPPPGALSGSFLVPYSFRQLDAFAGYQSGMPSPGYYQDVWEHGAEAAADRLLRAVAGRLRARKYPVSTADLIAARGLTQGLTALRGHPGPARTDVLDGLAGALISDDLDQPLPWTTCGTLTAGTHPVVVEMVAACSGERVGRLHPDTPAPPLVHDVTARLAQLRLDAHEPFSLDLTTRPGLERSRALHRLRVLGIPGYERASGPEHGADPQFTERWEPRPAPGREAALVEAGAYGARLDEAASVALSEQARDLDANPALLARTLFDAVLCGVGGLSEQLLAALAARVGELSEPGPLGEVLAAALGLWRHDRVYGVAQGPLLAAVIDGATTRLLWLFEGMHGGTSGIDFDLLRAVVALRDVLLHAAGLLSVSREAAAAVALRISADPAAPADLRGAACGLRRCLAASPVSPPRTPDGLGGDVSLVALPVAALGDWLAGLFALARDEVASLVGDLDDVIGAMGDAEFLTALPALRQAFAFFPPRERERIAQRLLERRDVRGSARSLLRTSADPLLITRAKSLEENVNRLLDRYGLLR
ncbi:DUF5682 family protein [Streptomyces sannanensis]|uniref:DUF5682 family protein n=1 Tax=Streptomyces sannanensis TaxID=285536 RepID=A0ABP6SJ73_9ACTN